jgi:hypothetical protein
MQNRLLLAGLLHLGGGALLPAQQRAAPFIRWEFSATTPETTPETTRSWRTAEEKSDDLGDYRYEGLALGGVALGSLGVWVGSQLSGACPLQPGVSCHSDKTGNAIALGLVGAAVGGGLGYLVGRFSPKRPPPLVDGPELPSLELMTVPDSVRKRTGYQHWRGAAIGLAVGGALGALTGAAAGDRCSDCGQTTAGSRALTVGLLGAGTGGVLGFLVGLASPKYAWGPSPP